MNGANYFQGTVPYISRCPFSRSRAIWMGRVRVGLRPAMEADIVDGSKVVNALLSDCIAATPSRVSKTVDR